MLDFNSRVKRGIEPDDSRRETIRAELLGRLERVLYAIFPAGKQRRGKFFVGDVLGSPGDSLEVELAGAKAGLWKDHATNAGGDIFDLIAEHFGLNAASDFPDVLQKAEEFVHGAPVTPTGQKRAEVALDDLGPATAKWSYTDADGSLLAVVYRYDPPGRRKEFRPWDAKRRRNSPPDPRPLYNQPVLRHAAQVVLVEGEKCAQALINAGIIATTAMHGANAPVEKTDWSPLSGKAVLIWPDRDKPGWEYATRAAHAVLAAGATDCWILYPPEHASDGWDAADALAEGFDVASFLVNGPRIQIHKLDLTPSSTTGDIASVSETEDALALAFTRTYGADWRYVSAWGRWLVWDTCRWRTDDTLALTDLIRSTCREAALSASSPHVAARLARASTVSGVERLACADRRHAASIDQWDSDEWLLNTPSGVVDLRTGVLRPHDRAHYMTKITTATPRGDCPTWKAFINDITDGNPALQNYLQRVLGYALTGSTQEHALFFLYGTGANGKSVVLNTYASILGDYATTAPIDMFMDSRSDRHPTDMAGLRGARFVSAIETEQGRRWAESKIKNLTGGDKVSARFMRQDFFEFQPQFKLFVAGNHKPTIRNVDEAMRRRLHLIPFSKTIPAEKRDPHLLQKLLAEKDAILAWLIEGCLAWQRLGKLDPPPEVVDATNQYFEAEDAVGGWLEERCTREANGKSLTAELFTDWKQWAESAGEFVGSQKRFSELLITRGIAKWRNSAGLRGFVGIALKYPPKPGYSPYDD